MELTTDNRKVAIAWQLTSVCLQYTARLLVALYFVVAAFVFFSIYSADPDVPTAAMQGLIQSPVFWNMSLVLASIIAMVWWVIRPPKGAVVKRGGVGGDKADSAGGPKSRPF